MDPAAGLPLAGQTANMSEPELLKTFNCGIGMIAVVAADRADALTALLEPKAKPSPPWPHRDQGQGVIYRGRLL
jgi:phosphoribosylformylglycinamidine cyclo-ligase